MKEEPNTKDVRAWLSNASPVSSERNADALIKAEVIRLKRRKRSDKMVLVLVGGASWCCSVLYILQWMRFPFRTYRMQVACMMAAPILLIFGVLSCIDRLFDKDKLD
jgi:hypothetical protein